MLGLLQQDKAEGDGASTHLHNFREPQLNARKVCWAVVTAWLSSGNSLSWKTIACFLTQGPEGIQLAHDRQGLCKDRWVLGAGPACVDVGFSEHAFWGGDVSVALETSDAVSVVRAQSLSRQQLVRPR